MKNLADNSYALPPKAKFKHMSEMSPAVQQLFGCDCPTCANTSRDIDQTLDANAANDNLLDLNQIVTEEEPVNVVVIARNDGGDVPVDTLENMALNLSDLILAADATMIIVAPMTSLISFYPLADFIGFQQCNSIQLVSPIEGTEILDRKAIAVFSRGKGVWEKMPDWQPSDDAKSIANQLLKDVRGIHFGVTFPDSESLDLINEDLFGPNE